MKALQDKNIILVAENDDLKKTILEQNKFYSKGMEVEKNLKKEISNITEENKTLVVKLNKLQVEITVLTSNITMIEKEKQRHLDFSAEEKENLSKKLNEMKIDNYRVISENKKINESFTQVYIIFILVQA